MCSNSDKLEIGIILRMQHIKIKHDQESSVRKWGYLVMLSFRLDRTTPLVPKFLAQTHPATKPYCSKPIQLPKFCAQNPSRHHFYLIPVKVPSFLSQTQSQSVPIFTQFWKITHPCCYIFFKYTPSIYLHRLFKAIAVTPGVGVP